MEQGHTGEFSGEPPGQARRTGSRARKCQAAHLDRDGHAELAAKVRARAGGRD